MSGECSVDSQLPVIPSQDETPEELTTEMKSTTDVKPDRQDSVSSTANINSRTSSLEETAVSTRKVAVSVHDERVLLPSYSLKSSGDFIETFQVKQDSVTRTSEGVYVGGVVNKGTSGDTQISLGMSSSVSGAEATAAILGASTSSLTSVPSSATYRQPLSRHRRFAATCIDENDLSTPYNYYRCLSPNEHHGTCWSYEIDLWSLKSRNCFL